MKLSIAFGISLAAAALALPQPSTIHKRGTQVHKRIIGGDEASENEFPFAASIVFTSPKVTNIQCGGIIISKKYIVTAAECLYDDESGELEAVSNFSVGYGSSNIGDQTMVKVLNMKAHSNYDRDTNENNIAVLKVEDMDLDGTGATTAQVYTGSIESDMAATVIGWGVTAEGEEGSTQQDLKKATVYIGDDDACKEYDSENYYGKFTTSDEATICVQNSLAENNGPCDDDFGGPLIIDVGGKLRVAGIYSHGGGPGGNTECATSGGFEFYESLESQLSFIRTTTGISL